MANRVMEIREQKGLARAVLARRAQTSAQQIERLEKGQRKLTLDWLERLGSALDVPPPSLVSYAADPALQTKLVEALLIHAGLPESQRKALVLIFGIALQSLESGMSVDGALDPARIAKNLLEQARG